MNYIKKKIEKKVHFRFNKYFYNVQKYFIILYYSNFLFRIKYKKNLNFLKYDFKNYLYECGLKKKNVL
jgi:hypothetical protein